MTVISVTPGRALTDHLHALTCNSHGERDRHPITMMTAINVTARVTSRKSLALAGYVSAFYVHDGVAEQGMKTLKMLETKHWDSCPIYLLHLVRSSPA